MRRVKPGLFIVVDVGRHERIASSLYSGRMLKSFPLGGAVRCGSRRSVLMRHALDDIQRFRAITVTLAANGPALPGRVASRRRKTAAQ